MTVESLGELFLAETTRYIVTYHDFSFLKAEHERRVKISTYPLWSLNKRHSRDMKSVMVWVEFSEFLQGVHECKLLFDYLLGLGFFPMHNLLSPFLP